MASTARKPIDRTRGERLEARITADQKALIQRAAELEGRSVTDYVVSSVQDAARRTVEAHDVMVLHAPPRAGPSSTRCSTRRRSTTACSDSVRRHRAMTGG